MGKLGLIKFRKNLKLNTRSKKLARFRQHVLKKIITTAVKRDSKFAKQLIVGSLQRRIVIYPATRAQSAQLLGTPLY